jgi:hypothetical protein
MAGGASAGGLSGATSRPSSPGSAPAGWPSKGWEGESAPGWRLITDTTGGGFSGIVTGGTCAGRPAHYDRFHGHVEPHLPRRDLPPRRGRVRLLPPPRQRDRSRGSERPRGDRRRGKPRGLLFRVQPREGRDPRQGVLLPPGSVEPPEHRRARGARDGCSHPPPRHGRGLRGPHGRSEFSPPAGSAPLGYPCPTFPAFQESPCTTPPLAATGTGGE